MLRLRLMHPRNYKADVPPALHVHVMAHCMVKLEAATAANGDV